MLDVYGRDNRESVVYIKYNDKSLQSKSDSERSSTLVWWSVVFYFPFVARINNQ